MRRMRNAPPRDRVLVTAQLFLGFRISEVIALTVGHVFKDGRVRDRVSLAPRFLKGRYGGTRSVPVSAELRRSIEAYLHRRKKEESLAPGAPLFPSRHHGINGAAKGICRSSAEKIVKAHLLAVAQTDRDALSTHSLRKSYGVRIFRETGNDLLCARDALGHSSVAVTQVYLPTNRARIDAATLKSDWTRMRRNEPDCPTARVITRAEIPIARKQLHLTSSNMRAPSLQPMLPGFDAFAR